MLFSAELARSGALFEQAYTPGPWTLPSVVSLMLSQPICRHRVVIDDQKTGRDGGQPPTLLLARGENYGDRSGGGGWGGGHDGVSPARGFAQSPLPPPRFGLFNA